MAYSYSDRDIDRTPIVNVGSRASIIYPGQSMPAFPTAPAPAGPTAGQNYASQSNGPNGQSGQSTQYGAPGQSNAYPPSTQLPGPPTDSSQPTYQQPPPPPQAHPDAGMTMLGGAREDITKHTSIREDPLFVKYLTAPLVAVAAPFVLAKEAIVGEPQPGPAVPRPPNPTVQAAPAPTVRGKNHEQRMEPNPSSERVESTSQWNPDQGRLPEPTRTTASLHETDRNSIAAELEALRRTPDSPLRAASRGQRQQLQQQQQQQQRQVAARVSNDSHGPATDRSMQSGSNRTTADGIVDRNDDGRIDQWIYRSSGEIEREELDEDFDGHVDRIIHTDLDSHQVRLVEEDNRGEGAIDTWTDYRQGAIARRRADTDGDGAVDTWSFYRSGQLVRNEQDTTHDGFRDAISFYRDGKRLRETRDLNGDGEPDVELFYDDNDRVSRREEDSDGDGVAEVVSHYRNGRLVRKELLDTPEIAVQDSNDRKLQ